METAEMDTASTELKERFSQLEVRPGGDMPAFNVPAADLIEVCTACRDDFGYDMLVDVTAIDWNEDSPRFTTVYHLLASARGSYLRLAVNCTDDESPSVPTLCPLYPSANWHERETYDMFGIQFEGHPDLRRILMWDDYPYYPLRKDFPLAGIETELPGADVREATGAKVDAAPMMGGPFHSPQRGEMSDREPRAADQSWTEKKPKPGKGDS